MAQGTYQQVAAADARKYGLPAQVFLRQIQQESGFNPNARSGAGAEGIAQFMPATAAGFHINPLDPIQALDAAARYDSQLVNKYGSLARALSAYNSGRPDAYQDPGFAGGQTYRYVKDILGGKPAGQTPLATALTPAPQPNRLQALENTFELVGLPTGPLQAALSPGGGTQVGGRAGQGQKGLPGPVKPGNGLGGFKNVNGIQVDARIAPEVAAIERGFGVGASSGLRTAAHNAQVGGAGNSDHLRGDAVDFVGSPQQMSMLQAWALRQGFPYVEPTAQTGGSHVHISFLRPGA